jgi:hypothetical protein
MRICAGQSLISSRHCQIIGNVSQISSFIKILPANFARLTKIIRDKKWRLVTKPITLADDTVLFWRNYVFVFPNKAKINKSIAYAAKVFLKHFLTKGMNSFKVIRVNKDLMRTGAMFY